MDSAAQVKAPMWFMVVSGILLLWNIMGVLAFFQHVMMTGEQLQMLSPQEQSLYTNQPFWVAIAFAFAVFGGTLGCVFLLAKKAFAKPILVLSLIGVVAQMSYSFLLADTLSVYGVQAVIMPTVVLVVAIFLVWFAHSSAQKNWLV